ncbi:MAG: hypothetical protein LBL87_07865 [Ruminococcus sp.]|jgi:hypothetical protein|nr:hypothetical protein [Ruminococcus sp.]
MKKASEYLIIWTFFITLYGFGFYASRSFTVSLIYLLAATAGVYIVFLIWHFVPALVSLALGWRNIKPFRNLIFINYKTDPPLKPIDNKTLEKLYASFVYSAFVPSAILLIIFAFVRSPYILGLAVAYAELGFLFAFLSEFGSYLVGQKILLKIDPDFGKKSWIVETLVDARKRGIPYRELPAEYFEELPAINHQYDFYLMLYVYSYAADKPDNYENAKRICCRVLDETPPDIIKDTLEPAKCDLLLYMIMTDDDREAITKLYSEVEEKIFANALLESRTDDESLMLSAGYALCLYAYRRIIENNEQTAKEALNAGLENAKKIKRKDFLGEYERDLDRVKQKAASLTKAE